MAFRVLRNVFALVLLVLIPVRGLYDGWRTDVRPASRARTGVALTAVIFVIVGVGVRAIVAPLAFYLPSFHQHIELANLIGHIPEAGAAVCCPLLLASNSTLAKLGRAGQYLRDVRTSIRLSRLRRRLDAYCRPILAENASWWEHILNPGFLIYRSLIAILDGKCQLQTMCEGPQRESHSRPHSLNVARLLEALEATPDHSDYSEAVRAYEMTSIYLLGQYGA